MEEAQPTAPSYPCWWPSDDDDVRPVLPIPAPPPMLLRAVLAACVLACDCCMALIASMVAPPGEYPPSPLSSSLLSAPYSAREVMCTVGSRCSWWGRWWCAPDADAAGTVVNRRAFMPDRAVLLGSDVPVALLPAGTIGLRERDPSPLLFLLPPLRLVVVGLWLCTSTARLSPCAVGDIGMGCCSADRALPSADTDDAFAFTTDSRIGRRPPCCCRALPGRRLSWDAAARAEETGMGCKLLPSLARVAASRPVPPTAAAEASWLPSSSSSRSTCAPASDFLGLLDFSNFASAAAFSLLFAARACRTVQATYPPTLTSAATATTTPAMAPDVRTLLSSE